MSYGFQVINDSGTVLIDDNHFSLVFKSKETNTGLTSVQYVLQTGDEGSNINTNMRYYIVPLPNGPEVLAVKAPNGVPVFARLRGVGTNTSFAVFCTPTTTARTLTIYRFSRPNIITLPTKPTYGLEVRNSLGQTVWRSDLHTLRIRQLVTLNQAAVGGTFALDTTRSFATVFCTPHAGRYKVSGSNHAYYVGIELTSASLATIRNGQIYAAVPGSYAENVPGAAMIVDVTGL